MILTLEWEEMRLVLKPASYGFVDMEMHEGSCYLGSFLLSSAHAELLQVVLGHIAEAGEEFTESKEEEDE